MKLFAFILGFIFLITSRVICDRIGDKIYQDVQADNACFRRMNATHQIGCTSERDGNVGVLHILENDTDIENLIKNGPNSPYITLFRNPSLFSRENAMKLKKSGKVNGMLIAAPSHYKTDFPNGFSPDKPCPNDNFGLYTSSENSQYAHCKQGNWLKESNPALNLMFDDWGFPISYVTNSSDLDAMLKCFEKYNLPITIKNHDFPMCAVELNTRMAAAKDTPTCMRRSTLVTNINPSVVCDPLGDLSLYTMLYDIDSDSIDDRSVIVVAARLDSFSIFHTQATGADSVASGLATLLAVSNALSQVREDFMRLTQSKVNVMFVLFNGEAFDYIGSSRMVYDMMKSGDPMKLSKISHIIEVNQLFSLDGNYWVHTDPVTQPHKSKEISHLVDILKKEGDSLGLKIQTVDESRALPSASTQSFLSKDGNISAIVLSNFDKQYENEFYNGMFDNINVYNIKGNDSNLAEKLSKISTAIARTVFKLATNQSLASIKVEETLVQGVLECYMETAECDLNKEALPMSLVDRLSTAIYNSYVGVSPVTNGITVSTSYLLQYLTGSFVNVTKEDCISTAKYKYNWISGPELNSTGVCYRSIVNNHTAVSPAFVENDWSSTTYSTWTESRWNSFSVRLFLKASYSHELTTLFVGIIITIVSIFLIYFIDKRADILFSPITTDMQSAVPC